MGHQEVRKASPLHSRVDMFHGWGRCLSHRIFRKTLNGHHYEKKGFKQINQKWYLLSTSGVDTVLLNPKDSFAEVKFTFSFK